MTPPTPRQPGAMVCAVCGQPITPDLWDMTIFANPTEVAYLPCLFAVLPHPNG